MQIEIIKTDVICKWAKVKVRKNDKWEIIEIVEIIDEWELEIAE